MPVYNNLFDVLEVYCIPISLTFPMLENLENVHLLPPDVISLVEGANPGS